MYQPKEGCNYYMYTVDFWEVQWQQQMENMVDNLLESSAKVVHTLEGLEWQEVLK